MYSIETIVQMNREAGEAARAGQDQPFVIADEADIAAWPPFPFPNLGDFCPDGWIEVDRFFCDSSGWGDPGEPALTTEQLKGQLKVGKGYAIVEAGQFQAYIGEFEPTTEETIRHVVEIVAADKGKVS